MVHRRVISLTHNRRIVLRSAQPEDVPGIAALFAGLSATSFTFRFRSRNFPTRRLLRLARIDDYPGTVSVVAEHVADARFVVAEARAQPVGDGLAELGISVADAYQSSGLGRLLLDAVLEQAQHHGLERLGAAVDLTNTAMLSLLTPRGWVISEPVHGAVIHLEGAPDHRMPSFPPRLGGRRVLVEGGSWARGASKTSWQRDDVVRRCLGPGKSLEGSCPLVAGGTCRLAESADVIVNRLPDTPQCAAVTAAHRRKWPERLA